MREIFLFQIFLLSFISYILWPEECIVSELKNQLIYTAQYCFHATHSGFYVFLSTDFLVYYVTFEGAVALII